MFADNWLQVRRAASVLCHTLFCELIKHNITNFFNMIYAILVPHKCLTLLDAMDAYGDEILEFLLKFVKRNIIKCMQSPKHDLRRTLDESE